MIRYHLAVAITSPATRPVAVVLAAAGVLALMGTGVGVEHTGAALGVVWAATMLAGPGRRSA